MYVIHIPPQGIYMYLGNLDELTQNFGSEPWVGLVQDLPDYPETCLFADDVGRKEGWNLNVT